MSFPVPVKYKLTATLDNIVVEYNNGQEWEGLPNPPEGGGVEPTGTKEISITENGVYTEDVTEYANAAITVNVGGSDSDGLYQLVAGTITDNMIDWSKVRTLRDNAFANCGNITRVGNPTVEEITRQAFYGCRGLTNAEITTPKQVNTNTDVFRYCALMASVKLHFTHAGPVTFQGNYFFANCDALEAIDIDAPNASELSWNASWQCYNSNALRNLVLRPNFIVKLTGGANGDGLGGLFKNPSESTIYVPSSLITAYQTANNWSTLYNNGVTFSAIEGSEYEL